MAQSEVEKEVITIADGIPLKVSLKKALWQLKKTALLSVVSSQQLILLRNIPLHYTRRVGF